MSVRLVFNQLKTKISLQIQNYLQQNPIAITSFGLADIDFKIANSLDAPVSFTLVFDALEAAATNIFRSHYVESDEFNPE